MMALRSPAPFVAASARPSLAIKAQRVGRTALAAAQQRGSTPHASEGARQPERATSSGEQAPQPSGSGSLMANRLLASFALWALVEQPAWADALPGSAPASSYYVSLGLFVLTVPGLYSLIKRSPKAKIKRKTFEVPGPAAQGAVPLDERARRIFGYFQRYNYVLKGTGDVIVFEGNYKASAGQAAALVFYTAVGLACTALVLSITVPEVGGWWYALCAVSPAAGWYYYKNADRTEEFRVKMVTSDDDLTTDIVVEGDDEEIERFWREEGLVEKGKVLVKGLMD